MSLIFHGEIRLTMMATGFICAIVVDAVVTRVTKKYRRALREAKRDLEKRVAERTADLETLNEELQREVTERAALQQHLVANERMAAAGTMAAAVSHEIRNPLMAIICNLEIAKASASGSAACEPLVEPLEGALEGAAQVQRIAVDLATLANPSDDELEAVDVAKTLSAAARLAAHHTRGVAKLNLDVGSPPLVLGSAPRLIQVFLNLITNAAQARDPNRPNVILVEARESGHELVITIADTGRGIEQETLDRIFEPFFTTKAGDGGTGLGLSICRNIVESCGGRLTVQSTVGCGTIVTVRLLVSGRRVAGDDAFAGSESDNRTRH